MPEVTQQNGVFYVVRDAAESRLDAVVRHLPHPNIITGRWRTALAAAGLAAHPFSQIASTILYGCSGVLDWFDGMKARRNNMMTHEGERLDPLVDKIINLAYLSYLSVLNMQDPSFVAAAGANIFADYFSQRARGPLMPQVEEGIRATCSPETCTPVDPAETIRSNRAVFAGKLKVLFQTLAIGGTLAAGDDARMQTAATVTLCVSAILGIAGTIQRRRMRKRAKTPHDNL